MAVRRSGGFYAVFLGRRERAAFIALGIRSCRQPDLADAVAVRPVAVLRVHDPAAAERDRPDVPARVVVAVGPQPAGPDRAAERRGPDREERVISELGLVVAHPERVLVSAQPRIERPMHQSRVVAPSWSGVVRKLPPDLPEAAESVDGASKVVALDRQDVVAVWVHRRLHPSLLGRELMEPSNAQAVDRAPLRELHGPRQPEPPATSPYY